MHVLRMLMHLSSGHMTLLPGEFQLPKFSLQLDLRRRVDSVTHVGLCSKVLV